MDLLNKFDPLKCKYLRANHSNCMTKEMSKATMLRTRFRYQFLKMKTPEAKAKYNKQQARSQGMGGERGEDSLPARLKQVQFALNRKHVFFDAMP